MKRGVATRELQAEIQAQTPSPGSTITFNQINGWHGKILMLRGEMGVFLGRRQSMDAKKASATQSEQFEQGRGA